MLFVLLSDFRPSLFWMLSTFIFKKFYLQQLYLELDLANNQFNSEFFLGYFVYLFQRKLFLSEDKCCSVQRNSSIFRHFFKNKNLRRGWGALLIFAKQFLLHKVVRIFSLKLKISISLHCRKGSY